MKTTLIAIIATFYLTFPDLIFTLPRVPAINYIGCLLVFFVVWSLMRFSGLVQFLRAGSGGLRDAS